jgi:hypothetical protein
MKNAFESSGTSPTRSESAPQPPHDFFLEDHGSIFLLTPISPSAQNWLGEHIGSDNGYQPFWPTAVVEHRCIADIVAGIQADGLVVIR